MDAILILASNPIEIFEEATRILLIISDNILKDPNNLKIRMLQKSNKNIAKKILQVQGGAECLKSMGFIENDLNFNLPMSQPLDQLKSFRNELYRANNGSRSSQPPDGHDLKNIKEVSIKPNATQNLTNEEKFQLVLPPTYIPMFSNYFLKNIENHFNTALIYENDHLRKRALSLIPIKCLEMKASSKLRKLQEEIKRNKLKDPEVDLQDFLVIELLDWFKNDFFEWIDSPPCINCESKTRFSHTSEDKSLSKYTDRVEMHICDACKSLTQFPRYNDLNILMETRKGRCGEWANTFTLFCRAMGWDSRYVVDCTDHVWTEVFSNSQKRWLHCDPCENKCDTPLMYESGWGKEISYIIAYSGEEIQDVTWRYSSKHKEVLARRKLCGESELISALLKLREERQKSFSKSRISYLTKRALQELAEFLTEKEVSSGERQGRITGSLDWRLLRGELGSDHKTYIWKFKQSEIELGPICLKYSSALNEYTKVLSNGHEVKLVGWNSGVFECDNVFRKEENDWNMSYLCRTEGSVIGSVTWKFEIESNSKYKFSEVSYRLNCERFEDGSVDLKICTENSCFPLKISTDHSLEVLRIEGSSATLTATLSGGKGNASWQHAQLFRENINENANSSFCVQFSFT